MFIFFLNSLLPRMGSGSSKGKQKIVSENKYVFNEDTRVDGTSKLTLDQLLEVVVERLSNHRKHGMKLTVCEQKHVDRLLRVLEIDCDELRRIKLTRNKSKPGLVIENSQLTERKLNTNVSTQTDLTSDQEPDSSESTISTDVESMKSQSTANSDGSAKAIVPLGKRRVNSHISKLQKVAQIESSDVEQDVLRSVQPKRTPRTHKLQRSSIDSNLTCSSMRSSASGLGLSVRLVGNRRGGPASPASPVSPTPGSNVSDKFLPKTHSAYNNFRPELMCSLLAELSSNLMTKSASLQGIARVAAELTQASNVSIWLKDPTKGIYLAAETEVPGSESPRAGTVEYDLVKNVVNNCFESGEDCRCDNDLPDSVSNLYCHPMLSAYSEDPSSVLVVQNHCIDFTFTSVGFMSVFGHAFDIIERVENLFHKAVQQQQKSNVMLMLASHLSVFELDSNAFVEIIGLARDVIHAERSAVYLVSDDRSEFTAHFQKSGEASIQQMQMTITADIAGEVASTGEVLIRNNIDDPVVTAVDRQTGFKTNSLIAIPITYESNVQAVAVVSNKIDGNFTQEDVELLTSFSLFTAVTLRNSLYYREMVRQKATTDMVLSTVKKVSESDIRDIDAVNRKVIEGAKELCNADRCALFMVDEEYHQLVAELQNGSTIKIPLGSGIAGTVGTTGIQENIIDAYSDVRFNAGVDRATGYRTQSILCYPIHCDGKVVAVAQLINKNDAIQRVVSFNKEDENLLKSFAAFAGITIGNARLYKFVVEAGNDAMNLFQMQSGQVNSKNTSKKIRIAAHEVIQSYKDLPIDAEAESLLGKDTFPIHSYDYRQKELIPLMIRVFEKLNLIEMYNIDRHKLFAFFATIADMYRPVPYHNISHAFDVMQTLFIFINKPFISERLRSLDILSLIIIGALHDIDHMGLNNSFHLKAETPLGILNAASGSSSVLEVHHCTLAIELLQEDRTNILDGLTPGDLKKVLKNLTHVILCTDMARHSQVAKDFNNINDYDCNNDEHRLQLMTLLTIASDVSNAFKPFDISRRWGCKIMKEFNSQGEAERNNNLPQTFKEDDMIYHRLISFCRCQVGFMRAIVLPLIQILSNKIPQLTYLVTCLEQNMTTWRKIHEECIFSYTICCDFDKGLYFRYYHKLHGFISSKRTNIKDKEGKKKMAKNSLAWVSKSPADIG